MIDTIVITLNKDMFRVSNPEKFTPSAKWALDDVVKNSHIVSKHPAYGSGSFLKSDSIIEWLRRTQSNLRKEDENVLWNVQSKFDLTVQ